MNIIQFNFKKYNKVIIPICLDINRPASIVVLNSYLKFKYKFQVVNAAFNLPVYFFAGHHFREALYQLLGYQ